jgi:hypothetical protein
LVALDAHVDQRSLIIAGWAAVLLTWLIAGLVLFGSRRSVSPSG